MAHHTRVRPWFVLSITNGNLVQLGGLCTAMTLLWRAKHTSPPLSSRLMFVSWLITYFCNHAIAHWAVGRLVGIRFVGYGVHGTTSPNWYPPGMRFIFQRLPLFSARTEPASLRAASPSARAAMYAAGTLFTVATNIGIPIYGRTFGILRARALLIGATLWCIPIVIVEAIKIGGDLQRAWRELRRVLVGS